MAWDRRLLSQSQHLTLLISGFRGVYPPTSPDGTYAGPAHNLGAALTFKVGLTKKYKPGKEYAKDAGRTFGLITMDAEEELRIQAEKDAAMEDINYDDEPFAEVQPPPVLAEEEEEEDDGRFDRFSLSGSLESLLDQALLKVIQLRRKFGVGWAGAEVIHSEMERSQSRAEDVFQNYNRVGGHLLVMSYRFMFFKGYPRGRQGRTSVRAD
jgi:ubiquitin-conjugating enzyme E2 Q